MDILVVVSSLNIIPFLIVKITDGGFITDPIIWIKRLWWGVSFLNRICWRPKTPIMLFAFHGSAQLKPVVL